MEIISFNGKWRCKPDPNNEGLIGEWFAPQNYKENDKGLLDIEIPWSFNSLEGYEVYEGVFWHFLLFDLDNTKLKDDLDYYIKFKGSNYNTKVWVNGDYLGEHNGGFTPFQFKIKSPLKSSKNLLAVRTDNTRRRGQIPDISFDWFNWGGIYRGVDLLLLNKNRITDVVIKTPLNSTKQSQIVVSYSVIGNVSLRWEILDTDKKTILFNDEISEHNKRPIGGLTLTVNEPKLWSPDSPNLYYIKFISTLPESKDEVFYETHFGIRQIEISGVYIYLNKRKFYFKGICLHEEYMPYGRAIPYEKREDDIRNMKSLGLNALRTAHYSHDEDLMDIADKLGLLILEEIPVYWHCDFKSKETFKTAAKMMRNLIKRDINHPSVVWWSVGNEIPIEQYHCKRFFKRLMDWTRRFDDTRIVTFVSMRMISDLTKRHADVGGINMYWGWYYGSPKMISTILDVVHAPILNKPLLYTEFGAGAKYGFRKPLNEQIKYSEDYQLYVLDYTIRTLNSIDYCAGWFLWAYRDFRAYLRTNQYQQGYNRKGIVSGEANEKKLIYHRIPKIIDEKREIKKTKYGGIIAWILLFPIAWIITQFFGIVMKLGQEKRMESGKKYLENMYRKKE